MIDWFHSLHSVLQAFIAGMLTWGIAALGAAAVFGFLSVHWKLLDGMLGFAGGVMLAASYWSLLAPQIEVAAEQGWPSWLAPAILVEPIAAVIGAAVVAHAAPVLPFALSFSVGAMVYVVVEELIPETQQEGNDDLATLCLMVGFIVMMILDFNMG